MEEVILWGISYDKKDFDFVFIATAKRIQSKCDVKCKNTNIILYNW